MPAKYVCPKCNRRFTQWGAEKFGFKCPTDEWTPKDHPADVELVRLGPSEDRPARRPTLKKGARKLAVSLPAGYGDETVGSDMDDLETAAEFQGADSGFDDADTDEDEAVEEEVVVEGAIDVVAEEVVPADAELADAIDIDDETGGAEDDEDAEGDESVEEEWQD